MPFRLVFIIKLFVTLGVSGGFLFAVKIALEAVNAAVAVALVVVVVPTGAAWESVVLLFRCLWQSSVCRHHQNLC